MAVICPSALFFLLVMMMLEPAAVAAAAAAAGMILTPLRFVSGCLRFLAASSAVLISCSMAAFSSSGLEPMRVKSSPGPMSWIVTCR